MRRSTSDEMKNCVCERELKYRVVKVGEWYVVEMLSSVAGSTPPVILNRAGHAST